MQTSGGSWGIKMDEAKVPQVSISATAGFEGTSGGQRMEKEIERKREVSLTPLARRFTTFRILAHFVTAIRRYGHHFAIIVFFVTTGFGLVACKKTTLLPNPVESIGGVSYIPIADTAFLIPEKTWLKGVARNSTDGLVCCINLHATIPDVQPWSQARHEEMYWPAGPGKMLEISIKGEGGRPADFLVSRSKRPTGQFIEEPSDQAEQGLLRFRKLWLPYNEKDAEQDVARFGVGFVEERRRDAGKPMMDTTYYEFVEHEHVKYFIYCSDSNTALFQSCHLLFPWRQTLMVDVYFVRDHIRDIVAMADKLSDKLREFETAGVAHRATQQPQPKPK